MPPVPPPLPSQSMLDGPFVLIILMIAIVIAAMASRRRTGNHSIPTLALRSFKIDPQSLNGWSIQIIGRPIGLIAWLLTVMKLDTETRLEVTDLQISIKSASLSGEFNNFIPLPNVSSTHCGYAKPIWLLIIAAITFLGGLLLAANADGGGPLVVVAVIIAALLVGVYFLRKTITILLVTDGGVPLSIRFKPGVIEGVPVNIALTVQALELLNGKVLAAV